MDFIAAGSDHSSASRRIRQAPSATAHAAPVHSPETRWRDFLGGIGALLRNLRRDLLQRRLGALDGGGQDQGEAVRRDGLRIVARRHL